MMTSSQQGNQQTGQVWMSITALSVSGLETSLAAIKQRIAGGERTGTGEGYLFKVEGKLDAAALGLEAQGVGAR